MLKEGDEIVFKATTDKENNTVYKPRNPEEISREDNVNTDNAIVEDTTAIVDDKQETNSIYLSTISTILDMKIKMVQNYNVCSRVGCTRH